MPCHGCFEVFKTGDLVTAGENPGMSFDPVSKEEIAEIEASGAAWHVDCYDGSVCSIYEGIAQEAPHLCWEWSTPIGLKAISGCMPFCKS